MDSEVVEVLKEIRDEAKQTNARLDQTNARLDQTNARLESLEGRVDKTNARLELVEGCLRFVEKSVSKGFERLSEKIRELGKTLTEQLGNQKMVLDLEHRVRALENRER